MLARMTWQEDLKQWGSHRFTNEKIIMIIFATIYKPADAEVPLIAVLSPVVSYVLSTFSERLLGGYKMGFELLVFNGLVTFIGLFLIKKP